ncbi:hypothetical protein [Pseudarthrobacter sp. NS4]|uniref:hypothetical protein n=1 Tax=Pseudarthrobacter sp. NS4 TaxID=2973976 RepID=UPI0021636AA9|nr:hypothetical protein [Pseudarthrobacter sp. NS4]
MEDPRLTARKLIEQDAGYLHELWVRYWANGGDAQFFEFQAYLYGVYERSPFDLKILTWVLEEISA